MIGSQARSFQFTYPTVYKWFFGVASAAFLLLFWLAYASSQSGPDLRAALFLAFALVSLYMWWRSWAWVLVDDETLTVRQLGRSRQIHFDEITRVAHQAPTHVLVIESSDRKVYIKKQLEGYGLFYGVVAPRFPVSALELSPFLPLRVNTRSRLLMRPWLLIAGGLGLLATALWGAMRVSLTQALVMAELGLFLLLAGIYFAFTMPRAYTFTGDHLKVHYLLRARVYPVAELRDIRLVTHSDSRLETSCLRLAFRGGVVPVRDQSVDYAPEALARALRTYYVPQAPDEARWAA